jgi:hypothetical protein
MSLLELPTFLNAEGQGVLLEVLLDPLQRRIVLLLLLCLCQKSRLVTACSNLL